MSKKQNSKSNAKDYLIGAIDGNVDGEVEDGPGIDRSTDGLEDHGGGGNVPSLEWFPHYCPVLLD